MEKFSNLLKVTKLVIGPGFEFRPPLATISSVTILLNFGTGKTFINGPMRKLLNRARLKQCLFIDEPLVLLTWLLGPLVKNPWIPHHTTHTHPCKDHNYDIRYTLRDLHKLRETMPWELPSSTDWVIVFFTKEVRLARLPSCHLTTTVLFQAWSTHPFRSSHPGMGLSLGVHFIENIRILIHSFFSWFFQTLPKAVPQSQQKNFFNAIDESAPF